jgi:hypothetical protein
MDSVPQSFFYHFFHFKVLADLFLCDIAVSGLIFVRDDAFRLLDDFTSLDIMY